jgi:hypothetical protein
MCGFALSHTWIKSDDSESDAVNEKRLDHDQDQI